MPHPPPGVDVGCEGFCWVAELTNEMDARASAGDATVDQTSPSLSVSLRRSLAYLRPLRSNVGADPAEGLG